MHCFFTLCYFQRWCQNKALIIVLNAGHSQVLSFLQDHSWSFCAKLCTRPEGSVPYLYPNDQATFITVPISSNLKLAILFYTNFEQDRSYHTQLLTSLPAFLTSLFLLRALELPILRLKIPVGHPVLWIPILATSLPGNCLRYECHLGRIWIARFLF